MNWDVDTILDVALGVIGVLLIIATPLLVWRWRRELRQVRQGEGSEGERLEKHIAEKGTRP
jgi:hypothetical protein